MNELTIIETVNDKHIIMSTLKKSFYKDKKYIEILKTNEDSKKIAKAYNYIGDEQKRKILLKLNDIFKLVKLNCSLKEFEDFKFELHISTKIKDIKKYDEIEKKYNTLFQENHKKWIKYSKKYSKLIEKSISSFGRAEIYQFFEPNFDKKSDSLSKKIEKITDYSTQLIEEKENRLENYIEYSINEESLHKFNRDIDEFYTHSFNFLWSLIKDFKLDLLLQIKIMLED